MYLIIPVTVAQWKDKNNQDNGQRLPVMVMTTNILYYRDHYIKFVGGESLQVEETKAQITRLINDDGQNDRKCA